MFSSNKNSPGCQILKNAAANCLICLLKRHLAHDQQKREMRKKGMARAAVFR